MKKILTDSKVLLLVNLLVSILLSSTPASGFFNKVKPPDLAEKICRTHVLLGTACLVKREYKSAHREFEQALKVWPEIRYREKHLAQNGVLILKFWLNVSKEEQKQRFLARLDDPEKHWKFSTGDVEERGYWDQYMKAYEEAISATSKPWAPWYAIPADSKPYMRLQVAGILADNIKNLDINYPTVSAETKQEFAEMRRILTAED